MPPSVNDIAERVYEELGPVTIGDEANGWPLLHFVHAWTQAMVAVEEIVRPVDPDAPPWAGVMNPTTAPAAFLDWLSQFAGRVPRPGETEQQKRDLIEGAVNLRRGSAQASRAIAARYLTGTQLVSFNERQGSAWRYAIRTRESETPDPAFVLAALMAQKPGGMILDYDTLAVLDYNYGDIYAVYDTYQQITDDPDYVTYADMLTAEPDIG